MTIKRVFSGTAQTDTVNRTDSVTDCVGIWLVNPDSTLEVEIDCYLQQEVSAYENRVVELNKDFVLDTETFLPLPLELYGNGLPTYFAFTVSFPLPLEIYAVTKDYDINSGILTEIKAMLQSAGLSPDPAADDFTLEQAQWLLQMLQLIAYMTGVPLTLLPFPSGIPLPPMPSVPSLPGALTQGITQGITQANIGQTVTQGITQANLPGAVTNAVTNAVAEANLPGTVAQAMAGAVEPIAEAVTAELANAVGEATMRIELPLLVPLGHELLGSATGNGDSTGLMMVMGGVM